MYPKSNLILTEIQDELAEIVEMKTVKFVWTPGHAGISGNEKANEGGFKTMPTATIDGGGGQYDDQSKIQRKKNYRTNLATIPMTRFKKTIERWKPNVKLNTNRHQQVVLSRLQMSDTTRFILSNY
jgi:hypothetical protein